MFADAAAALAAFSSRLTSVKNPGLGALELELEVEVGSLTELGSYRVLEDRDLAFRAVHNLKCPPPTHIKTMKESPENKCI